MASGKVVRLTTGKLYNRKQCICQNPSDTVLGPKDSLKTEQAGVDGKQNAGWQASGQSSSE